MGIEIEISVVSPLMASGAAFLARLSAFPRVFHSQSSSTGSATTLICISFLYYIREISGIVLQTSGLIVNNNEAAFIMPIER